MSVDQASSQASTAGGDCPAGLDQFLQANRMRMNCTNAIDYGLFTQQRSDTAKKVLSAAAHDLRHSNSCVTAYTVINVCPRCRWYALTASPISSIFLELIARASLGW